MPTTRVCRRLAAAIISGAATLALLAPTSATAATTLQCTGTTQATFVQLTPNLVIVPAEVQTVATTYVDRFAATTATSQPCPINDKVVRGGFGGGSSSYAGPSTMQCSDLPFTKPGTETITWSNGQSSTFAYEASTAVSGSMQHVYRLGTITSGRYTGQLARLVFHISSPLAQLCNTVVTSSVRGALDVDVIAP
jgi:hypothetical protein